MFGPGSGQAAPAVQERLLDNGLKVIVQEDHRAPVAVSQVWYKVGASYEHAGITGVSHALEHMMFQGTQRHEPGEFSRIIAENGGEENAFTSLDYTAYFQKLERSRLPVSFELEADRMRGLTLPEAEFAKEIKVVMEERRLRTEDDPQALLQEGTMAVSFQTSPYRNPVIGWMQDLEQMQVADLRRWYERWYAPNNATLVVVGDVVPEEVFKLAERHFGPLPRAEPVAHKRRTEVPQKGMRRITVREVAKLPYLTMGYKAPVLADTVAGPGQVPAAEVYALEVLAGVLSGGESARLPRRLVREQAVAADAGAGYDRLDRLETLFVLSGVPAEGRSVADLEAAMRAEVEALKREPVAASELDRVKARVIAAEVYERDSQFYQGMQIGILESVGLDWRLKDQYVAAIQAVTADAVQAAARKYLLDDRLTVGVLEPIAARKH